MNYSIQERDAERRLLPLAADRGIAVIANRPYAGGDLFGRVRSQPLPALVSELGCESWGQFFLKFIIGHPAITCAIPATSKVEHLRDNMGAATGALPGFCPGGFRSHESLRGREGGRSRMMIHVPPVATAFAAAQVLHGSITPGSPGLR
ncbi:MAG TPA: aldo/keto reductase [Thermoanaerobaculia bacterium]|nr:aldo/keto reductase [Thermoanaerobaculia bacterium]